jgi:P-type E1-E2 ATPase
MVLVAPGDVVPVDGIVAAGVAVLDESALTGEVRPAEHVQGDGYRAGW